MAWATSGLEKLAMEIAAPTLARVAITPVRRLNAERARRRLLIIGIA
jgi:hypothetical protein